MKSAANIPKPSSGHRANLKVHDVLFVLFKQKWKILFLSLVGFGAAGALLYTAMRSPSYETQAKLLVRYVLERSTVDPYESKVDAAGVRGMSVMDAEIEIIRSTDLLHEVVQKIGPEKILPNWNEAPTEVDAVLQIMRNLEVTAARGSNVIHISYRSQDPTAAIDVLNQLIDCYFAKHLEIHRSTGAFENVARQAEQARSRLSQTEAELNKLNQKSGVMSLADSKTALEARRSSVRASLLAAQVEYAEQQVRVASIESAMGVLPETSGAPDTSTSGLQPVRSSPEQMETVRIQQELRDLAEQLSLFKQRRNELLMTRKPGDLTSRASKITQNEIGYNRVTLSMMLAGACWAALAAIPVLKRNLHRILLLGVAGAIAFGQALTGGRTGYVTWIAVGLLLATFRWRKLLLVIPFALILVSVCLPGVRERMLQGFGGKQGNFTVGTSAYEMTSGRDIAWPLVIEQIGKAPWIGYGREAMLTTGISDHLLHLYDESFPHPHQAYLQLLLDNGVIGILMVIPFFLYAVRHSYTQLMVRSDPLVCAIGCTAFCLILALMIGSFGGQTFYPREGSVGMWAAIGLMLRVHVNRLKTIETGEPLFEDILPPRLFVNSADWEE